MKFASTFEFNLKVKLSRTSQKGASSDPVSDALWELFLYKPTQQDTPRLTFLGRGLTIASAANTANPTELSKALAKGFRPPK
jgi:hypothetical protein